MINQYISNYVTLSQLLIGEITQNIAAVSLHIESNTFIVSIIFFDLPTEDEIEVFEDIEAEFVASHSKRSRLSLYTLNKVELIDIRGNIGWVFLRKEATQYDTHLN